MRCLDRSQILGCYEKRRFDTVVYLLCSMITRLVIACDYENLETGHGKRMNLNNYTFNVRHFVPFGSSLEG